MENVINSIVALSQNATDLIHLNGQLKQSAGQIGAANNAQALAAGLNRLDAVQHSLGILYLLDAQIKSGSIQDGGNAFIDYVSQYLQVAMKEQISLAPDLFVNLCREYKKQVVELGCPRKGILPLLSAIRTLQPTSEVLTPIHAEFLQLCLLSKCYNAASPLLDDDICSVDPVKTCMTPTDLFLYAYYGGTICIGRKHYAKALELFLQALTAPSMVGNAIVVAAYKKYVLASLIHTGAVTPLPKFTPSKVRQVIDSECRAYNDLSTAYATHSAERLRKCMDQHGAAFTMDNNMGLVKLVSESLTKRNIQRLTQTYLTLSLGDIASQVGLPSAADAELHMLRMIESGEIHAEINQRDGMVNFLEDPEQYNSAATAALIDSHISSCMKLAKKLQDEHDAVSCDRRYLAKVSLKERSRFDASDDYMGAGMMFQP